MTDENSHDLGIEVPRAQHAWRDVFLSLVPLVSIVFLVIMIGVLLWVLNRSEKAQLQSTLVSDAHWVEQALRYQLAVSEDMVARMALDSAVAGAPDNDMIDRARAHLASNPEVLRFTWHDAASGPLLSVPPQSSDALSVHAAEIFSQDRTTSSRPVYSSPYRGTDDALQVDLGLATADGFGAIVATISLTSLIRRQIPWWIAEKYAVQMQDSDSQILLERSHPDPVSAELAQLIAFDPPIPGASLRIAPYAADSSLSDKVLPIGIVGVAVVALLSLAILQSQSSRRQRAEERLSAEIAFRHSMEESLTVGIRAKDHGGRYLYVNKALTEMVGYDASELVGKRPPMPYWLEDIREDAMARHNRLGTSKPETYSFDSRFKRRDGAILDVHIFEAPLIDSKGKHQGWICSIIDVTEQRKAEQAARDHVLSLQRSGRLISLGEMASTLAHELNQPLSAIASYAAGSLNVIRSGRADATILAPVLEKLAVQVDRSGKIIHRIQDFVRKRDPVFASLSLAEVIEATAGFLAPDANTHGVKIRLDLAQNLSPVMADSILIEQVLINLIRNGIEAMTEAGTTGMGITVRLRLGDAAQVIEVIDRGPGISLDFAPSLFEAFTTTRPEGMGIGLNVCRSIIELHKGRLSHHDNPEGGTIFRVSLPEKATGIDTDPEGQGGTAND